MQNDPRNVREGWLIPTATYCDQPYVIKTDDGAWLCTVTTGAGHEGDPGQHVTSMRSTDHGKTWSTPVPLEPPGGPEASYSVMLNLPGGRVFCFYNHTTDRLPEVKMENGQFAKRVDTLGNYVFKYSDDHGKSWSAKRYVIDVREFECDRQNTYTGKVRFFWNVGRPVMHRGAALLTLHKVGAFGEGFLAQSEGVFLRSENLLTESDPAKITFETLPDGDVGLRSPRGGGRIAEEQSVVVLSDGTLYCVYRTVDGFPVNVTSVDGGRMWTEAAYMRYGPSAPTTASVPLSRERRIKHPRAATFVWKCANGRYLYWFHNHGGELFRGDAAREFPKADPYNDRNPAWIAGGVERDDPQNPGRKTIEWSEPEVLLYDDDPMIRMSYPDMVEENGAYYFTETQKAVARTHLIDNQLIEGTWSQFDATPVTLPSDALLAISASVPSTATMPKLPAFLDRDYSRADYGTKRLRTGVTVALTATIQATDDKRVMLLETTTRDGRGLQLRAIDGGRVELTISDGRTTNVWASDTGSVPRGKRCHIAAVIDSGPGIIMWIINGTLCDGGDERQFGWGRMNPQLLHINGSATLRVGAGGETAIEDVRIYGRALRVSELVRGQRGN